MKLRDRGMVKWAPYKSLPEQEEFLTELDKNEKKVNKPTLMDDKLNELDDILSKIDSKKEVSIIYYEEGIIKKIDTFIKKVDEITLEIKLKNKKSVKLENVLDINIID